MAVFGYDETQHERWTLPCAEGGERSPREPERRALGHVVALSEEVLDAVSRRVTTPWSDGGLASVDVLVVAEPTDVGPGVPTLWREEPELCVLRDFVRLGGSLLVLTGAPQPAQHPAAGASAAARLLEPFGIRVTGRRIHTLRDRDEHLLSTTAVCRDVTPHQCTRDVAWVVCHNGVALECSVDPLATVGESGATVFAAVSYGAGKVAAIGSSELFSEPHIGEADNALLCVGVLAWLAGHDEDGDGDRARRVRRLLRSALGVPGGSVPAGAGVVPVVDVRADKDDVLPLCPADLDPYEEPERFLVQAGLAFHGLPEPVRRAVLDFRDGANEHGALLVQGLPSDRLLPPTPTEPAARPVRGTYLSEFWLAVFSRGLGDQVGYAQEGGGSLFQNVIPTKENAENLSSESSRTRLDFHTEMAFHPAMPDYLLLSCLRPAPHADADTLVAGVRGMAPLVPPVHRSALFRRAFRTGVDLSFGSPNGRTGNGPLVSVFQGDPFDPLLCLDPDLMVGVDEEAGAALEAIKAVAPGCEARVTLRAGDLLLIDNRRAIHGRSPFTALFNGQDRWLQRSYVVRDLQRYSAELGRTRRVISTAFAV